MAILKFPFGEIELEVTGTTATVSDTATLGTSTSIVPSQRAVKVYVDTGLSTKQNLIDSSAVLAAAIGDETGSGVAVFATSPTLVTPVLGVATATSINKVTITAPTTSATLTLVTGSSLITSGAYSITFTAGATTTVTLPASGTLATLAGSETLSNKTLTTPVLGAATATSITIAGGGVAVPILIGTKADTSSTTGLELVGGADDTGGVQIYCDDGGIAVANITTPLRARYLLTASQSSGATQTGLMAQLRTLNSLTFTNGGIRGAYIYNQVGATEVLAGTAEYVGLNQATTIAAGAMTVGATTMFAGIDINLGGTGTFSITSGGVVAALVIRDKGEGAVWPIGIHFATSTVTDAGNWGVTLNSGWISVDPTTGGSFGAKLMFSNVDTSLNPLSGLGLRCRSYETGAIAIGLNVSASAAHAGAGQLLGGQFYLQNSSTYTIAGVFESTALYCKSWLDAACSPSASALWIDDESDVKATTQYMVDITMNGTIEIDKVFHIYGGDPGADTFIDFDTCDQGTGAFVAANTTAVGSLTNTHRIKCTVNGSTVGYLHLFSN